MDSVWALQADVLATNEVGDLGDPAVGPVANVVPVNPQMYAQPTLTGHPPGEFAQAAVPREPHHNLEWAQCWITTGAVTITAISCHSGADMSLCDSRWPEE
jgi:hypothetical protein